MTFGGDSERRDAEPADARFQVLIVGGGVAGLEALLALRDVLGPRISITLLCGQRDFVYRPLAVAEPFGMGEARRVRLDRLVGDLGLGVSFRQDRLSSVDPAERTVATESGAELSYDALLLALGTRAVEELPGALTYAGPASNEAYRHLLDQIEAGAVERLAFAAPVGVRWALPLYELALLTAQHAREREIDGLELVVASAEAAPLEMFGGHAAEAVGRLLGHAGIEFRGSSAPSAVSPDGIALASGERLPADRVVTLPRLEVVPIPGIPQGPRGFLGTDSRMRVEGLDRVWAAGDSTWFPIKQGGLAAQQAEVAAMSIASTCDPRIETKPFRPRLRAALLTGAAPLYMRSAVGGGGEDSALARNPLWWPPAKIAAQRLTSYLHEGGEGSAGTLRDEMPLATGDEAESDDEHRETVEFALRAADADARWGDHTAALRWLQIAEELDLTLPPAYEEKRRAWGSAS